MPKRKAKLEIVNGGIQFSRHWKPIVETVCQAGQNIHVVMDTIKATGENNYSTIVERNGKLYRAGHMKPTIDEAVLAGKEFVK